VTSRRYRDYRKALSLIGLLDEERVGARPIAVLRDAAERMLLSRSAAQEDLADDLDELAGTLTALRSSGAIDVDTATRLWRLILACGPPRRGKGRDMFARDLGG
jgi:hypothetical protein